MGRNPSVGGFRRDKIKNWPESFPRTTRKGYGKDTTARLEVSEGIRLRIGPNPFLGRPERVMERIPRRDWRFPEG
jgi:hypothetical protein